ncbi:MAG: MarR family transcriptional regulator [Anaerolineales bacterium]|nr:MarR family transcriptional regulator [Anaerolineales bacterium]
MSKKLRNQVLNEFWGSIPPFWNFVRSHIRSAATGRFEITVEQFHVLRFVRRGMSVSELAVAKNISRPAISQAVDALVKKGWLAREQNPKDRRYVALSLTAEGNALLDEVFKDTRVWMDALLKELDDDELKTLSEAMKIFKKILP